MLDSVFIGMSGLAGYSKGLRVIANNTANINTPGFKGASLQFADLFYAAGPDSEAVSAGGSNVQGQGLNTFASVLNFSQGELRSTDNDLDLAIDGLGLFMLKDANGLVRYTRDGQFKIDDNGNLVSRTNGLMVLGRDLTSAAAPLSVTGLRTSPAKATSKVELRGTLASGVNHTGTYTLGEVSVRDTIGAEHRLTLQFDEQTSNVGNAVVWKVTVKDSAIPVGEGELMFVGNQIDQARSKVKFTYAPSGSAPFEVTLDFSQDVTSQVAGNQSSLAVSTADGYAFGNLTAVGFDANGQLNLTYSNGQVVKDKYLALARFDTVESLKAIGDNLFEAVDSTGWSFGTAQTLGIGAVAPRSVESSNVDLSSEFSNLVIMQRGYQASSQVVTTANEMIQELFSLKGRG